VDNPLNLNTSLNSRFLENGAYIRAQRIALGYNFANSIFLNKIYLSKLRVFGSVDNAFIITGYSGLDPDMANSITSNAQPGLDFRSNPVPRTFTFGVNASF